MNIRIIILISLLCASLNGNSQVITTIAGTGAIANTGDNGPALTAAINYPAGICFDKFDNLYISLGSAGNRIRKINELGVISTIAGTGASGSAGDGALATAAQLHNPQDVVLDTANNIFIAEAGGNRIRKINITTGIITTVAGTGTAGFSGDGGPATDAMIFSPDALCFDKFGNLYIGDQGNYRIRKVDPSGIISTVAGNGIPGFNGDYGLSDTSEIVGVYGLCTDDTGNLYIADGYSRVRKVNVLGYISTFAGSGVSGFAGDGGLASIAQTVPVRIIFDKLHNLYIGEDAGYNRVRKVDTFGIITTVAGNGTSSFSGDDGPATDASIYYAAGLTTDVCGNLYISDLNNRRIRKITYPPVLTTPIITLSSVIGAYPGSTVTVNATVSNAGSSYDIEWYNHGVQFATTTVPSVTYTKTNNTDTITARVVSTATYGCYDSTLSAQQIVLVAEGVGSVANGNSYSVYPNPVGDVLHVDGVSTKASYRLYNVVGSLFQQGILEQGGNSISVKDVPASVYMLEVVDRDGNRRVRRVVKE